MTALEKDLQEALQAYLESDDDGLLLLEVIRRAGQYQLPIPDEAHSALSRALVRYHDAESRTLDEALNVSRPKGWSKPAARKRSRMQPLGLSTGTEVYFAALRLHADHGLPLSKDGELWERVGQQFNLSPATAFEIYHEARRLVDE